MYRNITLVMHMFIFSLLLSVLSIKANAQNNSGLVLDYFVVQIDGKKQILQDLDTLLVVHGQKIRVIDAFLNNGKKADKINIVGYITDSKIKDFRNVLINTARLDPKAAVSRKGDQFAIQVESAKRNVGLSYIRIVKPKLKYLEILINQNKRTVRDGDILKVKLSDEIKIEKIVTNIENAAKVKFIFDELPSTLSQKAVNSKYKMLEIRFFIYDQIFAKIPMQVESL